MEYERASIATSRRPSGPDRASRSANTTRAEMLMTAPNRCTPAIVRR